MFKFSAYRRNNENPIQPIKQRYSIKSMLYTSTYMILLHKVLIVYYIRIQIINELLKA